MRPHFYVGIHHPSIAGSMERTMLSINVLENRKIDFPANKWILDSGAFTGISRGQDHMDVKEYGKQIKRWAQCGELEAAVSHDWMCEPQVLKITGLTVEEHQSMTTGRWLRLREEVPDTHLMPVIQGWEPDDYRRHLQEMERELPPGTWAGVGSVCKRQGNPSQLSAILTAILTERPDLKLHGFGVKTSSLKHTDI